jgi:hypothetical protein
VAAPSGDRDQNRVNFAQDFGDKEFESWGGGRGMQGSVYLDFDEIPEDYSMPQEGKSKSQLYVDLWNQYVQQPLERVKE